MYFSFDARVERNFFFFFIIYIYDTNYCTKDLAIKLRSGLIRGFIKFHLELEVGADHFLTGFSYSMTHRNTMGGCDCCGGGWEGSDWGCCWICC
jgi:hypothetical protein